MINRWQTGVLVASSVPLAYATRSVVVPFMWVVGALGYQMHQACAGMEIYDRTRLDLTRHRQRQVVLEAVMLKYGAKNFAEVQAAVDKELASVNN